ncbi:MAG: hypothetical protein HQL46_08590, partial [Gammaproteobacteria bacterium]|nr:hypothetical protein [Gammaproteobacteria bacterium]
MKKIAFCSPLLPKKTGIAAFNHLFIQQLIKQDKFQFDIYDTDPQQSNKFQQSYQARDIRQLINNPQARKQYHQFIYHFGNNARFHYPTLRLLRQQPGIVVLHDTVMYHLMVGQNEGELSLAGLWLSLQHNNTLINSHNSKQQLQHIINSSPDKNPVYYPYPQRFPLLKEILNGALSVVVHSQTAVANILKQGYAGQLQVIKLPYHRDQNTKQAITATSADNNVKEYIRSELKPITDKKLKRLIARQLLQQSRNKKQGKTIITNLGFAGSTKRIDVIKKAIYCLPQTLKDKIILLIIGEGH